ncbi:MAG: ABC transporter ATP-binding protein [Oscillospiraceae bacterium]|nr:ABC transporter ATP-binding protein [Oscillospiraceae bacterium]
MKGTVLRILRFSGPFTGYLILAVVSALIGVSLSLIVPILIGKAVDCAAARGGVDFRGLLLYVLVLSVCVLASTVLQWLQGLFINRLAFGTVRRLREALTAKLGTVPVSYIDGSARGDLMARIIPDIETVSDGLLQGFAQLFTGAVTILGTLVFMLSINVKITAVVVVMTPLSLLLASQLARRCHSAFEKQAALRGELGALTEELVGSQKLVREFAYEERSIGRFCEINARLGEAGRKATFLSSLSNPSTRFVNGLIYAAVGTFGALGTIGVLPWVGAMSVGQLASFLSYSNQYTKPFNEISGVMAELQNAVSCASRVFEVLDAPDEPDDSRCAAASECRGALSIEDVSFSYLPEKPLIRHFSMQVQPGQRIAIVGPTGCGKSTVINLLLRFYDVQEGRILLDGTDTREMTRDSLRSCFGMVLQETWIFTGTVAENIAYGCPDATREEIVRAAKSAHAHSFIGRLPQGYDTVISDASGLSQGQKQLLCIARIMLTDPPMLILDEATSSIDLRTEQRIQRDFEKLMQGRTSFIIAHRLSTIRTADRILVMKSGQIVEQGDHASLMAQGGFYASLYKSQFAG